MNDVGRKSQKKRLTFFGEELTFVLRSHQRFLKGGGIYGGLKEGVGVFWLKCF